MQVTVEKLKAEDAVAVFDLVSVGFEQFVRSDLTDDGVAEFYRAAGEYVFDTPANHQLWVAKMAGRIVGMMDVRDEEHICLFFVSRYFQKKGVGRALLDAFEQTCPSASLSVNSSVFAVDAYKKLGFEQLQPVQIQNGIRFVPMQKYRMPQASSI